MDEFIAGYGPLPANLALSQTLDAHRTAALLDRTGPPFAGIPNIGSMSWGPAAAQLQYEPPAASAEHVRNASCCSFPRTASLAKVTKHCTCALYSGGINADFFRWAETKRRATEFPT